jgi:hypothetical protein
VGGPGAGNITCNIIAGTNPPIGTCSNPQSCNPQGDVCGGKGDGQVNARQDCCDCAPPKFNCCKPDSNGVPRCYGTPTNNPGDCKTGYTGQPPCCIAAGQQCAFSSECCGGTPCLPDAGGTLRCQPPETTCVNLTGACTSTGDCCAGGTCSIVPGALTGLCTPTNNPTVPTDGGVTCHAAGTTCAAGADCCTGLMCLIPGGASAGVCGIVPVVPDGGSGTDSGSTEAGTDTSVGIDTAPVCQPGGGLCGASADCCAPLSCLKALEASNGICGVPPPPACAVTGQTCGATSDCCAGYQCYAPGGTGQRCPFGQTGCSCFIVIY